MLVLCCTTRLRVRRVCVDGLARACTRVPVSFSRLFCSSCGCRADVTRQAWQSLRERIQERDAAVQVRCKFELAVLFVYVRVPLAPDAFALRDTHAHSQGLLYEPDVGPKASIVAGVSHKPPISTPFHPPPPLPQVRASPVKFCGFNSPTQRFIYPQPCTYPSINPEVGPNASLAGAMQVPRAPPSTLLHRPPMCRVQQPSS